MSSLSIIALSSSPPGTVDEHTSTMQTTSRKIVFARFFELYQIVNALLSQFKIPPNQIKKKNEGIDLM